jgi:hypothetical protein
MVQSPNDAYTCTEDDGQTLQFPGLCHPAQAGEPGDLAAALVVIH